MSSCKRLPEKISSLNGIRTHDLCDTRTGAPRSFEILISNVLALNYSFCIDYIISMLQHDAPNRGQI